LRRLHKDKKCPICKSENATLVVDADQANEGGTLSHKAFADYEIWGDELGGNFTFHEDVGMFFPVQYYRESVLPLFSLRCGFRKCDFTNEEDTFVPVQEDNGARKKNPQDKKEKKRLGGMKALKEHLRTAHGLTLCQLCVDAKRDFVSNLARFTPSQLKDHQTRGDGSGTGFKGHPLCNFCRPKRFYDLTKLHEHLNLNHYKCYICEKQGLDNQFFKDYQQLMIHFDRQHFLCPDPQCIAARFVVFGNEIDLRAHEFEVHGGSLQNKKNTKIQLEFRINRSGYDGSGIEQTVPSEEDFQYGLDGEVFVPESLPVQENEPVMTDPTHAARTAELRAQAQRMREQQRVEAEGDAFPTLQEAESSRVSQQPLVGWTSASNVRRALNGGLTAEDFPALAPTTRRPTTGAVAANSRQPSWAAAGNKIYPSAPRNTVTTASANSVVRPSLSGDDFPSLGGARTSHPSSTTSRTAPIGTTTSVPSLKSEDFPSLGGTNSGSTKYASAEAFAKKYANARPSADAMANILQPPAATPIATAHSSKAQVDKIKLLLGPNSYKKLKNMTKDFSNGSMGPQEFVDRAASLFESGVKDPDFLSFMPNLIQSCPNDYDAARALSHLESIRHSSEGLSISSNNSPANFPSLGTSNNAPHPLAAARAYAAKKAGPPAKSAWGGQTGSITTAAAKSKVAAATSVAKAAEQMPTGGTATSFMAKALAKEKKQLQQANNVGKGPKKQERDELRALAFGGR